MDTYIPCTPIIQKKINNKKYDLLNVEIDFLVYIEYINHKLNATINPNKFIIRNISNQYITILYKNFTTILDTLQNKPSNIRSIRVLFEVINFILSKSNSSFNL